MWEEHETETFDFRPNDQRSTAVVEPGLIGSHMTASMLRASQGNDNASFLGSSAASRMQKSFGGKKGTTGNNESDQTGSLRKSSGIRRSQSRKRKQSAGSSSRRRKRSRESPDRYQRQNEKNAAYNLFAERHLRRIQDSSQGVNVNTKYELTAANTSKLWSKFEQEILGKQAHDNLWRATQPPDKSQKQPDFLESATKFRPIGTFAVGDPDMAVPNHGDLSADGDNNLLKSSYVLHSYAAAVNPDHVSPLRRSTISPTRTTDTKAQPVISVQESLQEIEAARSDFDMYQRRDDETITNNRILQPNGTDPGPASDQSLSNRLLAYESFTNAPQGCQQVPFMQENIPLSEQIKIYQRKQDNIQSSRPQHDQRDLHSKQSPTRMSSLSKSPVRSRINGLIDQNRLLQYFSKGQKNHELYENYVRRGLAESSNSQEMLNQRHAPLSPLPASPEIPNTQYEHNLANALIAQELGGSPLRSKSPATLRRSGKSPYASSIAKRRLTVNVQSQGRQGNNVYFSNGNVRSSHNSSTRRGKAKPESRKSMSPNSCCHRSAGSNTNRECCNVKKVRFDLMKTQTRQPACYTTLQTPQVGNETSLKRKRSTSRNSQGAGKIITSNITRPRSSSKQRLKQGGSSSNIQSRSIDAPLMIQDSAQNQNINGKEDEETVYEDRPCQISVRNQSPSAQATQKFFFKKQVQSLTAPQANVRDAAQPPPNYKRRTTPKQVDTLSKQLILRRTAHQQPAVDHKPKPPPAKQSQDETDYRKMLKQMVSSFKRRSQSRGRHQSSQANVSQVAACAIAKHSQSMLDISMQPVTSQLDQTICKAQQKNRQDLNKTSEYGVMTVEKRRARKQVIDILSDVLDHRQAIVKTQVVRKLTKNSYEDVMPQKRTMMPTLKPMSLQQQVVKLTASEKLLMKLPEDEQLRSVSAYFLCLSYFEQSDYVRLIRYLEFTKDTYQANPIKEVLEAVCARPRVKRRLASNCLHILALKAECLLLTDKFSKAAQTFNQVCHLYNYWDFQTRNGHHIDDEDHEMQSDEAFLMRKLNSSALEFGVDDYIKARAGLAECLMHCERFQEAIQKFEGVKTKIEAEIVFDKPILFINICNQLGNCYLKAGDIKAAKDTFEQSLRLIQKLDSTADKISDDIVAKIYLNLGIIQSGTGQHKQAFYMHEKSLEHKLKSLNGNMNNDAIMSQFVMLAHSAQNLDQHDEACCFLEKALTICRMLHGDFTETTAYSMIQLANAYQSAYRAQDAINILEHSGMILSKLEGQRNTLTGQRINEDDRQRITLQLNKMYLMLIGLYLSLDRKPEADQLIIQSEARLEQNLEDQYTFKLLNELGNLLRKHEDLTMAVQLYKKSLLSIKIRFKNDYLQMRDTAKILINIASTEYMRDEGTESVRYYKHALSVLRNCKEYPTSELNAIHQVTKDTDEDMPIFELTPDQVTIAVDVAKVHVSLGHLLRQLLESGRAHAHFVEAQECLNVCGDCSSANPERYNIMAEARKALREIRFSAR